MERINEIIGNYISDNKLIQYNIFKEIIKIHIENENLGEVINNTIIRKNCISRYSSLNKKIYFNPFNLRNYRIMETQTITKLLLEEERNNERIINPNSFNILNLFYLMHEINHAIQCRDIYSINSYNQLQEGSCFTTYIYLLSIDTFSKIELDLKLKNKYYKNFHNYFYSEYNANINAFIYVLSLLNSLNISKINKLIEKFNLLIASDLLDLYKKINNEELSSPVENFIYLKDCMVEDLGIDKLNRNIIEIFENFENEINKFTENKQFERLQIGFSIDENTQSYLSNVSKGKEKTLNLFDDIKCIN